MDDRAALAELVCDRNGDDQDADTLLTEFGTLGELLTATPERLAKLVRAEVVARVLALRRILSATLRNEIGSVSIDTTTAAANYLRFIIGSERVEHVHALYLRADLSLIRDEPVARGHRSCVSIDARDVARRAIELGADGLILAHNHPSGSPIPSDSDVRLTRALIAVLAPIGVRIMDHLLVTRDRWISMRAAGLM